MRDLPLFPLHSVLCPGIALPLHIFEPRYREMIGHCLETGSPFGVVLIREGRDTGPVAGHIADVGTMAAIRKAGRYPDGRLDIMTVGEHRFRIRSVDPTGASYLVGIVEELDEPLGGPARVANELAEGVGRRFLAYLEQLQVQEDAGASALSMEATSRGAGDAGPDSRPDPAPGDHGQERGAKLIASARRLLATGDPTAISYLLTALVQLDLAARQALLEIPDTTSRLRRLDAHLAREEHLLTRNLRPMALDLGPLTLRRN
jgi:uncharacterized protein